MTTCIQERQRQKYAAAREQRQKEAKQRAAERSRLRSIERNRQAILGAQLIWRLREFLRLDPIPDTTNPFEREDEP